MKKKIVFIIATLLLTIIGGIYMYQEQKKQEMLTIATSEAAKKVYEDKFRREDPLALTEEGVIQSYEIDEESLDYNPMGGLMVNVVINEQKDLYVSFNLIDNQDGTYHSAYFGISPKLGVALGY